MYEREFILQCLYVQGIHFTVLFSLSDLFGLLWVSVYARQTFQLLSGNKFSFFFLRVGVVQA